MDKIMEKINEMKMPWTKAIERLAQKMENSFKRVVHIIDHTAKTTHEKAMVQINILKKSEQIKHNRIVVRLAELEDCFKGELSDYRRGHEEREITAAKEIDEALN